MHKNPRSYTKEFKEEAVRLALKSKSIVEAANDLGVPSGTLHGWVHKSPGKSSSMSQPSTTDDLWRANRELQKRIARLEEEKAILKKAATYFAKELG